jgi:hypothetical protein
MTTTPTPASQPPAHNFSNHGYCFNCNAHADSADPYCPRPSPARSDKDAAPAAAVRAAERIDAMHRGVVGVFAAIKAEHGAQESAPSSELDIAAEREKFLLEYAREYPARTARDAAMAFEVEAGTMWLCARRATAGTAAAPVAEKWAIYYDNLSSEPYESQFMQAWQLYDSEGEAARVIEKYPRKAHYRPVRVSIYASNTATAAPGKCYPDGGMFCTASPCCEEATAAPGDLPLLPEPKYAGMRVLSYGEVSEPAGYTANQMLEYGRACIASNAGAAPADAAYRLIDTRDTLKENDEWLAEDAVTWRTGTPGCFVGMRYAKIMLPARRHIAPSNPPAGAKEQTK